MGILITSCSCGRHVPFSSSMGAGVVWRKCSCRVAQSGKHSCTSRVAQSWELRNLLKAVAQAELPNPTSCASRVAHSWKLRKWSCAILGVVQAKFCNPSAQSDQELRNPSCAIRRSCGIGLYSPLIPIKSPLNPLQLH